MHFNRYIINLLDIIFSCIPHAFFITAIVLDTNLELPTRALQARRTDIGRHCNSVETAQLGDRTTDPWHRDASI